MSKALFCFYSLVVLQNNSKPLTHDIKNTCYSLLTNEVSGEIVLKLNIIVIFSSIFIEKYSLEVFREKAGVSRQVKFEMSTKKREIKLNG